MIQDDFLGDDDVDSANLTSFHSLKLSGMAQGFEEQLSNAAAHSLAFEDRFAMLVDHEATHRENQRPRRLLKTAKLKVAACVETSTIVTNRGLDKSMMASLLTCQWIERGLNMILTGPTGCGKTWTGLRLRQSGVPNRQNSLVSSPAAAAGGLADRPCRRQFP